MYSVSLEDVRLPITPGKITTKINNKNKTIDLLGLGEVNILKPAGLTDITFECMIPAFKYPFAVYPTGFKDQRYFLDYFEKLKTSQKPFQFIIFRIINNGTFSSTNTNIKVSLEDYQIVDDANEGVDMMISISLKQFKDFSTQKIVVKEDKTGATDSIAVVETTRATPAVPLNKTWTVKKGDNLWTIAKINYGDATKYKTIAKKNNIKNPNKIYPGQVLTL